MWAFFTSHVAIGENVWVGTNVLILRGTKIGNDCVIGTGSIIKVAIPDYSIVIQKRTQLIRDI